ncbi:MAG: SHOCT domain-containing protein [Candidatus Gracilibacteria bacterium]
MKNIKILFRYIVGILGFLLFIPYVAADDDCCWGMMGGDFGFFGAGYGFIFMIIFWGIIIYFVILAFKSITNKNEKETPLKILKKRLAKGEISEGEFEKLRKKL